MTLDATAIAHQPLDASAAAGDSAVARRRAAARAQQAAEQFESLVLRQLLHTMRRSAPQSSLDGEGEGDEEASSAGQNYLEMFDDAMADQMALGGGIGIAEVLRRNFAEAYGVDADQPGRVPAQTLHTLRRFTEPLVSPTVPSGERLGGATGRLQGAARATIGLNGDQWSRDGALTESDLASTFATDGPDGIARFNVRDANGFQGYYKCNLFAFEVARRGGFDVPVVGRSRGWGYPAPEAVNEDARDGALRGNWGRIRTADSAAQLQEGIRSGQHAFMLSGSSTGERPGHMAVIEQVHSIDRAPDGSIRRIVFDGWEARPDGASHLSRRTWNVQGNPGGTMPHEGFESIEIIGLVPSSAATGREVPISTRAGRSVLDLFSSSLSISRPKTGSEEQS